MTRLFSGKSKKGAAFFVAFFSISSFAQEVIIRGNRSNPHQPPEWFARMAKPELLFPQDVDGFTIPPVHERSAVARGRGPVKYACPQKTEEGGIKWIFCDMY